MSSLIHQHGKLIAAVALAAAAIFDWTQPPAAQFSVRCYDWAVIAPYRYAIHPVIAPVTHCRFRPTCSRYSQEAMHAHGFLRGLVLTGWRIMRCGPWTKEGTVDPVPE
jgi:putative membrane protein insertion efficiency factor